MEITFAGTGSGKVSLERYFSSFLLSLPGYNLLIEAGDGASRALEQSRVDITQINSILISHFHPDHVNGISSLIIQMKMRKRKLPLHLIVHENLTEKLTEFLQTGYVFRERLGFEMNVLGFKTGESFSLSERLSFTARENSHLDKYEGTFDVYKSGRDKSLLVSCGFLFKAEDIKLFYTGDMGAKNDLYLFHSEKPGIMITETTHVELSDILEAVREQLSIRKILLTHISDEAPIKEWLGTVGPYESEKFIVAYDTMKWDFGSFI
ncbi:MAG TPA: MBL fold metallo-hydrolase [Ignavibacteriales bacterium]|nr:MBL fold metallo-hydrolase [Ignavibacteriales bacterium]